MLKWDLKEMVWKCVLDSSGSECGPVAAFCGHSNELSDSTRDREFLDQLWASFLHAV